MDVVGGLGSLVSLALFLRFWQPKQIWRFADEAPHDEMPPAVSLTRGQVAYAWVPWALLSLLCLCGECRRSKSS